MQSPHNGHITDGVFTFQYTKDGAIITGIDRTCANLKKGSLETPSRFNGVNVVGIAKDAFAWSYNLSDINLNNGINKIDTWAFWDCPWLAKVTIPESVKEIGDWAFGGCASLVQITLQNGIERLGASLFNGCASLRSIDIPESVRAIGEDAFENCPAILNVYENSYAERWALLNGKRFKVVDETHRLLLFQEKSDGIAVVGVNRAILPRYSEITIPQFVNGKQVVEIGKSAFIGCDSITKIAMCDGIKIIGNSAFARCASLSEMILPESVKHIEEYAFARCYSLVNLRLPPGIESVSDAAFDFCPSKQAICKSKKEDIALGKINPIELSCENDKENSEENGDFFDLFNEDETIDDVQEGSKIDLDVWLNDTTPSNVNTEASRDLFTYSRCSRGLVITGLKQNVRRSFSELTIPSVIKNQRVVEIADNAFRDNKDITNVVISEGIEKIGNEAFRGSSLSKIFIPRTIRHIGEDVFSFSNATVKVAGDNPSFCSRSGALFDKQKKSLYYFPPLHSIQPSLLYGLETIRQASFSHYGCPENLIIPKTVKRIETNAFTWSGIPIHVEDSNQYYSSQDGALFDKKKSTILYFPGGLHISRYQIPRSVRHLGEGCFCSNDSLEEIILHNGIETIGCFAFQFCEALTFIAIPSSVKVVSDNAFSFCSNLTRVTMEEGIISINWFAFSYCTTLKEITIPQSVSFIDDDAFNECPAKLLVYEGSYAERWAREHSRRFEILNKPSKRNSPKGATTLPTSSKTKGHAAVIRSIMNRGPYAPNQNDTPQNYFSYDEINGNTVIISGFDKTKPLEEGLLKIPNTINGKSVVGIGTLAFAYSASIERVIIPASIKEISTLAFCGCQNLATLEFEEGIEIIGERSFSLCPLKSDVFIPKSVREIGTSAFDSIKAYVRVASNNARYHEHNGIIFDKTRRSIVRFPDNSTLTTYNIPEDVQIIEREAFARCQSLKQVSIPKTITNIGEDAFTLCGANVNVANGNDNFSSVDGILFDKVKRTLFHFPPEYRLPFYYVPTTVSRIMNNAFCNCISLTEITLPFSVTKIGEYAFQYCSSLQSIVIPPTVKELSNGLFSFCSDLSEVIIPEGVKFIGRESFEYCGSLPIIIIPQSVTVIDKEAFENCPAEIIVYSGSYAETWMRKNRRRFDII